MHANKLIAVLMLIVVFSPVVFAAVPMPCPAPINTSHSLTGPDLGNKDVTGASNNVSGSLACIVISGSNLVFDCNNHWIYNNGTAGYTYGIYINGSQTNVTIINCGGIYGYYGGIWATQLAYGNISNNVVYNNADACIYVGSGTNLTGNTVYNCTYGFNENGQFGDKFTSNTARNNTYGFYILSSTSGTLTNNVAYNNSYDGFYLSSVSPTTLTNNTAYDNSNDGFEVRYTNSTTFTNNTAYNNNKTNGCGFDFGFCHDNVLTGNKAYGQWLGFYLAGTDNYNNTLINNTAYGNQYGINPYFSYNSTLTGNTAYNNSYGIILSHGSGNTITGNTARNNTYGFDLQSGSSNNTFTSNTGYNNSYAFRIEPYSDNNTLAGNVLSNSSGIGIYVVGVTNTVITNDRYYNNAPDFKFDSWGLGPLALTMSGVVFDNDAGSLQNYTNISVSDTIAAGETYSIDWAANQSALPASRVSFQRKFVNITALAGTVSINQINWTWLDSELSGYDEHYFELWKYNATGNWTNMGATPNASANTLTLNNLAPGSTYGLLQYQVPNCLVVNSSYTMGNDFSGAPNNASEIFSGAKACVKITASNLVFDCNGHSISSYGTAGTTYGIALNGSLSNVTVKNCQIWTYSYSILANLSTDSLKLTDIATDTWILLSNTSNSDFEQLNVSGSLATSKIEGSYVYNSVFRNINMQNASYFYLYRVSNVTVDGANVSGHNQFWFEIDAANNSLIQNVNASDVMYAGFYSDGSVDNYNSIYRNFNISTIKAGYWGFDFYNMHNCTAENINIANAGTNAYGMDTYRAANSTIRNVNITNNEKPGLYVECQNTSISNVVIDGTAGAGVYLYHDGTFSGNNNITGLVIRNSQDYAIYSQPGTLPNFLNNVLIYNTAKYLRLQSNVSFTNLALGYSDTQGIINWNSLNLANGTDLVNGTDILLDPYFVSLDSNSSGASQLNSSANVTVATESCAGQIFKMDGFPLNRTVIYTNGTLYAPFGYDSCAGTTRTFAVDGFSGYATSVTTPVTPSGGGGGGAALKRFTISATQVCPGNKIDVYAYTSTGELTGADVREVLSDPYQGLITQDATDATGHVTFDASTEGTYTLRATKIGYANPSDMDLQFTYCAGEAPPTGGNVTPPQPPTGGNVTTPTNVTQPPAQDMQQAQQGISDAQSAISDAAAAGKDASGAKSKLADAQSAFDAGNYQQALELANEAKQLALGAAAPPAPVKPPVAPAPVAQPTPAAPKGFDWMPLVILVVLGVVVIAAGVGAYMLFGQKKKGNK